MIDTLRSVRFLTLGLAISVVAIGGVFYEVYHKRRNYNQRAWNWLAFGSLGVGMMLVNVGASLHYNVNLMEPQ